MKEAQPLSIADAFGDLRDPRNRTPAHDLTAMLLIALCAILSGADSWVAIQVWGEQKLEWLRRHTPLPHGIPSHDTFGRVFAALNARQFEACFMRWMSPLLPTLSGQVVAIDGKTVRGSHRNGERAIHLVSAFGSGLGAMLGQVRTADKSNEITAIPELLDALLLKGAIVTIDAMGCQQAIARQIVENGADYVLAVKENQPSLLAEIRASLEAIERLPADDRAICANEFREVEKDHGRIETRRCVVSDLLSKWRPVALWPGMRSIAMVESTREIGDTVSVERRYYVSSLPPDAARIAHAVRSHWRIENSMHWVLDVAFGEDQCRVWVDNAAQNFAILRRITMNLLRRDTSTKAGIKIRRLKAATSDRYRDQLLGW
ncbi:ISAs1 family transposase [Burkholderia ubonensis]|uniref:ISAs1 family transposase n=2 Tax=Burkholderia ubonensis TaxID=101571 RepID=UPI0008FE2529|nr:ISAs1 family transposase [Burkholderia ubonensis]OJA85846.1 transposase [Burkholderia ubonensis]